MEQDATISPEPPAVAPAPPAPPPEPVVHRFDFHGSGGEYFRIWIVNLALSIVTIGIYSAWAKVRRLKYMHGATTLDGSAFGYHGDPPRILKGRIIGAALFGAYALAGRINPIAGLVAGLVLFAFIPWLMVKSMKFRTRMTSWRGLRLNFNEDYKGAYLTYVGWMLLTVCTLGLLGPQFVRKLNLFFVNNTKVGDTPMKCDAPTAPFYWAALQSFGLFLLGLCLVAGLVFGTALLFATPGEKPDAASIGVFYLAFMVIYAVAIAHFQAKTLNAVFSHTTIGPHRLSSHLSGVKLSFIYVTNLLGILCTLGLFIPWASVRLVKYRMDSLSLIAQGPLDDFVSSQPAAGMSAVGEEISDIFDVDFGL